MQIGKPAHSKGSNDVENLRLPAKTFIDKQTNEVYVADGYGNHRVIVYDADTGQYKRHWGAYGHKPDDADLGNYDPDAPPAQQFRNPVHCADMSVDRLVYVCDRVNDRIQVFKPDGTFVKEGFIAKRTLGSGSAWDIAFSKDPQQKYIYLGGWRERPRPHPLARHPRSSNHFRGGWTAARRILRPAQHRHGFQRQHLRDGDLSRATRPEVRLQRPGAGHEGRPGRPVAEEFEKVEVAEVCRAFHIVPLGRRLAMTWIRVPLVLALMAVSSLAVAQDSMKKGDKGWTDLEKQLADINDQWVCAHKYHKNHAQDCVDFKNNIWPETFFEISRQGEVTDKQEMVKRQTATATAHPVSPGDAGPNPQDFKLMAVYGDVALAADRTVFKAADASGKIVVTDEATVLRMFVKLDGKWRPAGAALVPVK